MTYPYYQPFKLNLTSAILQHQVDMLVGDIYGNRDYSSIGLSSDTIASSFGKVISQNKNLSDYHAGDLAVALCRMISFNIA